ncbi:MAG TPA: sialate O-acetylesterase [Puia sp.]|nr:sialate O-acetylesterase [Puia sp.]
MVLQRDQLIPVWGWAEPGERITLQFDKQTKTTRADKSGKWMIKLDAHPAGGPFQLVVRGKNVINLGNILIGEVWLCSGQSNMEMPIEGWGKIKNYEQEIANAEYPEIRHIKIPNSVSSEPKEDVGSGTWEVCSPQTAAEFSATAYFFARELYQRLHVPIGLINSSWGGTMIETWISRAAFEGDKYFKKMIDSMATGSMEELARHKKERLMEIIRGLQGIYKELSNTASWKEADFDDKAWPKMKLPGLWEQQGIGLEDLDGLVWFRKTVIIDDIDAGRPGTLDLGKIDDSDETYVNGIKIGEMKNKYSEKRHYIIPAGILKPGANTISVKVEDTGGGGGFYGESTDMKLVTGSKSIKLAGEWLFKIATVFETSTGNGPNSFPTLLFNAMINPLIPYAIKGAIWYQGESNASRAYEYRRAFPLMITDWRNHWHQGDFPFYFVQLSSFNAGNGNSELGSSWAELREAQTMTLSLPNTGMAVTTDIGDANDIHPKDKQDVGKRLAVVALDNLYQQPMEYSGPLYQSVKFEDNKAILTFTHLGDGLMIKDRYGYLKGFELADQQKHFHYAKAEIEGDHLIVYQDGVNNPSAVRYAWADDALEANLFNKNGLPACAFRTDSWDGLTAGARYAIGQ